MIDEKVTLTGGSENNDHIVSKWQRLLVLRDTVGAIAEWPWCDLKYHFIYLFISHRDENWHNVPL